MKIVSSPERSMIASEIKFIMTAYGITVDRRHLMLLSGDNQIFTIFHIFLFLISSILFYYSLISNGSFFIFHIFFIHLRILFFHLHFIVLFLVLFHLTFLFFYFFIFLFFYFFIFLFLYSIPSAQFLKYRLLHNFDFFYFSS